MGERDLRKAEDIVTTSLDRHFIFLQTYTRHYVCNSAVEIEKIREVCAIIAASANKSAPARATVVKILSVIVILYCYNENTH